MKTCTKCGQTKPLDEFHRKNNHGRMGYHPSCKVCRNTSRNKAARERAEKIVVREFSFDTHLNGWIVHSRSHIPYKEIDEIRNAGGFSHYFPEVSHGVQP